ncbi:MAG: proprotein convertase P-domain-containing protein, partial [Thermoanaerobaculia bacterium]
MSGFLRFLIPLLALSLPVPDSSAQPGAASRHRDTWAIAAPAAPSPREAATRLLELSATRLAAGDALELAKPSERTSLTASHYFFPQTIGDVPVLNGGVAISIRDDGTASIHDRTGSPSFGVLRTGRSEATSAAIDAARHLGANAVESVELVAWVGDDGVARAYQRVILHSGLRRWAVFVDAESGVVAWTEPLFMTARGQVFDPNPVTALNDPTLVDGDDSDASVPSGAYASVELPDLGSAGPLAGPHATIVDIEIPTTSRADLGGSLSFTRSRDEFEEVNAYFHVDRSQRYLQSLGFTGGRAIVAYSIEIDTHAAGGNDDSSYRPSSPGHGRLFFGDGGVDDAEDGDIVLHEYGHAIQDSIVPSGFTGPSPSEPRALGEGFCDYWAFSASWAASRASGRDPFCVGDWDARCAPGPSAQCGYAPGADCLRRVDGTKTMADYLRGGSFGTEHLNGEIWSSALRDVFVAAVARLGDEEGRRTVDRTILESHFGMPPNPSFRTAALRMIDADRRLNRGALTPSICTAMAARGIVATADCDLGLRGVLTLVESPARDVAVPDNDPNGVSATLRVSDTRVAEELFVRVNIAHPRRGDLRLTLTAPDGASIVLQVENDDSAADIKAVYGLDAEPSQPLTTLAGKSAAGTWTLRVTDTFGVDEGRLVTWGMMFRFAGDEPITTRGTPGSDSTFIPVAGSVAGAFGTRFLSDARIANIGTATARATLFFTPSGADGTVTFSAVKLEIPPGETVALDDFVASLFHESGTGAIEIRGDTANLIVTSRIYNDTENGTYGQFVRFPRYSLAYVSRPRGVHILHLSNGPESRSNLGITEVAGAPGSVEIRLADATGVTLSTETLSVA